MKKHSLIYKGGLWVCRYFAVAFLLGAYGSAMGAEPSHIGLVLEIEGSPMIRSGEKDAQPQILDSLQTGDSLVLNKSDSLSFTHHKAGQMIRLQGDGLYLLQATGVKVIRGGAPSITLLNESTSLFLTANTVVSGATRLRSGLEILQLSRPLNRTRLSSTPKRFEWDCPDEVEFEFVLKSESGEVLNKTLTKDRHLITDKLTLEPGNYQWRVSYDDPQANFKQLAQGIFTVMSPSEEQELVEIQAGFSDSVKDQLILIHVLLERHFHEKALSIYADLKNAGRVVSIPRLESLGF